MFNIPQSPLIKTSSLSSAFGTPINFSRELKEVLTERNLLTVKTRKKVCSMLDKIADENNEIDKRETYRRQAIQEILDSEMSYLRQLEVLNKYFIVPLKERKIIDEAMHTTLFGQVEMIYNLNGELLITLENNLDDVGNAFLKMAPFFKLYSVYAFDYKNALLILQDLTINNPMFREFIQNTETRPEVQTKLNSLMITPIQRVPRYKLLLEQVLLYTSPADSDFKILKESVKQVESTITHINSVIEEQEVTQMLINLQNSLLNRQPHIVKPSRKVIKEGVLEKVARNGDQLKRYCVLMSDIFMYCKILKDRSKDTIVENSLECCCIFPLKKCKVYDVFPGTLKITCQGDGIILCTPDYHLAQSWVTVMKETIDLHIQCRKTLRKESSKRTPLRKKDVKSFEIDDILSPSKRRSDYDSIFRCKTESETDEDDDDSKENIRCFNIPERIMTRSIWKGTRKNTSSGRVTKPKKPTNDFNFKIPGTPPSQKLYTRSQALLINKIKTRKMSTQSSRPSSSKSTASPFKQEQAKIKEEEYDSTYGFANRFSETKSYFKTNNIDSITPHGGNIIDLSSNIVSTPINYTGCTACASRTISDLASFQEEEGIFKWIRKRKIPNDNFSNTDNNRMNENPYTTIQKKRVQFEDLTSPTEGMFPRTNQSLTTCRPDSHSTNYSENTNVPEPKIKTGFRQRILDFIQSLF